MRQLPQNDYLAVKAAWRDLVAAVGGPQRAAHITRGAPSRISEAMAPHCPERFPAADQIADLESECGQPVMTRALAGLAGYELTPLGDGTRIDLHHHLARIVGDCGDVATELAAALADGTVSEAERLTLIREIEEARDRLLALKADLKRAF